MTKLQTGWLEHNRFVSHSSWGWESKIKQIQCLLKAIPHIPSSHPSFMCHEVGRGLSQASFVRVLIPFRMFHP
jgi:hypothetical protein